MPSRSSRPSATPAASRSEARLPAYQPPAAPLNAAGQQALQRLQNQDAQKKLNDHFKHLSEELAQSTYTVTSSHAMQEAWMKRRKDRQGEEDPIYKSRLPGVLSLGERVDELNLSLEAKMREAIDAQSRRGTRLDALKEISTNISRNNGRTTIPATQSTLGASQFRSRIDEDEDEEGIEPTTPTPEPGIPTLLKHKVDQGVQEYDQLSLGQRYAQNNDYIEFRRLLHDGKYSADEADQQPVMPHASTWFDSNGPVFLNGSQAVDSGQDGDQVDSDVEAVAESINTKCPITLTTMQNPVKSLKCPHNFESAAIHGMIQASTARVNGRSGQRVITCPVCNVKLTADDLVPDGVTKRRIERNAASQTRMDRNSDDEEDEGSGRSMRRAQTVDSQFEPNLSYLTQIKKERASGVSRIPATQKTEDEGEEEEEPMERQMRPPISTAEVVELDMEDDSDEQ